MGALSYGGMKHKVQPHCTLCNVIEIRIIAVHGPVTSVNSVLVVKLPGGARVDAMSDTGVPRP